MGLEGQILLEKRNMQISPSLWYKIPGETHEKIHRTNFHRHEITGPELFHIFVSQKTVLDKHILLVLK